MPDSSFNLFVACYKSSYEEEAFSKKSKQNALKTNVHAYSVVVRNIKLLIVIQLYETRKTVLFVGKLSTQLKHVGRISSLSNVVDVIIK